MRPATWAADHSDPTGKTVYLAWVDNRNGSQIATNTNVLLAGSTDGVCQYGFTVTRLTSDNTGNVASLTRQCVDTGLSDAGHSHWFSGTTNGNSRFIGDYNGIAVGPEGVTWSLWTDHRNLVANPPSPTRNHGQHAVGARTP